MLPFSKHPKFAKLAIGGLLVSGLAACASGRHLDRERDSESYQKHSPVMVLPEANGGYVVHPGSGANDASGLGMAGAITGLAVAGAAANPGYYKKSTISGNCVLYTTPSDSLGIPCRGGYVVLLSDDRRELERAPFTEGKFSFRAEEGKRYFLDVEPRDQYELVSEAHRAFGMGDEALLSVRLRK